MKQKNTSYSFKLLSVLLSAAILLVSLPLSAIAIDFGDGTPESTENTEKAAFEMKDKRTEKTKTFRLCDGSYYIAQYDSAVHYEDSDGRWQDIDNTISDSGSEYDASDAKIKFAKKITGNESLFTLHNGNRKLTLSLNGAIKKTRGNIKNHRTEFGPDATELQKMTTLDKISASVKYEDILPGTDLEYVISGMNIKENIIIKERQTDYSFTFTMALNGLCATLSEEGEIVISDALTEDAIYLIPSPFMYDGNGIRSQSVALSLGFIGDGKYTLTIVPDADWVNDEGRAFPVTVDPPIYANADPSVTDIDMNITSDENTDTSTLYVGSDWRAYWKLNDLPALPVSAYITNAEFTMNCITDEAMRGTVAVYDVMTDWDSTLTWSKVSSGANPQGVPAAHFTDYADLICEDVDGFGECVMLIDEFTLNVTPIVRKWYSGQNYGMMFAPKTGTGFSGVAIFRSSSTEADEADEAEGVKPRLCITYRDMKGVEDYWTFSSQSAGFAGTGAVNHATGNLVLSVSTLTSTDALMPYTPSLIYNSALAGKDYVYPNVQVPFTVSNTPFGFRQNFRETLLKKNYTDENGVTKSLFIRTDGDGTEHYFMPTSTADKYADEDGLLLILEESASTQQCTITDSGKNVRTFARLSAAPSGSVSGWYLTDIADRTGNKIVFGTDASQNVTSVSLVPKGGTAIEQLKMSYDGNNKIYIVRNPNSEEAVIFRYSPAPDGSISTSGGRYLRQVVRAHGTTSVTDAEWRAFYNSNSNNNTGKIIVDAIATYTYNSKGLLTSVTNAMSKYMLEYVYDGSNRVVSVKELATAGSDTSGQQISLDYGISNTVIRTGGSDDVFGNDDDLRTVYSFDGEGRTVSCYTTDLTGTRMFGASNGTYVGEENEKARNSLKSSVKTSHQSSNYLLNGGFDDLASEGIPYWNKSGTAKISKVNEFAGAGCAELTVSSQHASSSISQQVYLKKGDYSLTAYVNDSGSEGTKIYLKAESASDSSHSFIQEISTKNISYSPVSLNFSVDPAENEVTECFNISVLVERTSGSKTSTVYADNIMLAKAVGASEYDLLKAGHFEIANASLTDHWDMLDDNFASRISVEDSGIDIFGDVLKIDPAGLDYGCVEQKIVFATQEMKDEFDQGDVYFSKKRTFTISGWGKGTAQAYSLKSGFRITAELKYYNGTANGDYDLYSFNFNNGINDWQFLSGGFESDPEKGMLESITVSVNYYDQPGIGYFDNISLVENSSTTVLYSHDKNGKLRSFNNGYVSTWYKYDEDGLPVIAVSSDRNIVEYEYNNGKIVRETHKKYTETFKDSIYNIIDKRGNIITDSDGKIGRNREGKDITAKIKTNYYNVFAYNTYGQLLSSQTYDCSGTTQAMGAYRRIYYNTYPNCHIFGTVSEEYNELGNATLYYYDEDNGRLLAVISPEGHGTCYSYDAIGNLTEVLPAELEYNEDYEEDGYSENSGSASVNYTYDSVTNRLNTIATASTTYTFVYDVFGNTKEIRAGAGKLVDYDYNVNNGKLNTLTYGNGLKVKYIYDALDRISEICHNNNSGEFETVYSYEYDSYGNLFSVTDHLSDETTVFIYGSNGRISGSYVYDENTKNTINRIDIRYDDDMRIDRVYRDINMSGDVFNSYYSYSYNADNGFVSGLTVIDTDIYGYFTPEYDGFGRLAQRTIDFSNCDDPDDVINMHYEKWTYSYSSDAWNGESSQVNKIVKEIRRSRSSALLASKEYRLKYDRNGNITEIADSSGVVQNKYYYDDLGQLIREDNRELGYSYTYAYDNAGNRTLKKRFNFTLGTLGTAIGVYEYSYSSSGWGDRLTYDDSTYSTITYDATGNPTYIENEDDPEIYSSLKWRGRLLMSFSASEGPSVSYTYNADGIRTSKTVNGVRHKYYLDGSRILGESWTKGGVEYFLYFIYDENGSPVGLEYRTSNYDPWEFDYFFFDKNVFGDVIGVYNENGKKICTYTYNAWGECTTEVVGSASSLELYLANEYNPFRYRGYYYDIETRYYYLQTRYYNPAWGRFLNADGYLNANGDLLGYNMFAYCSNNPVMGIDPSGTSVTATFAVMLGFAALAFLVFTTCTMTAMVSTQSNATTYPNTFDDPFEREKPLERSRTKEKVTVRDSTKDVTKNKDDSQSYNYWAAEIVDNQVVPIKPLTYSEARAWVDCGHNLLCRDHASAIAIVKFYPSARYDHKHKDEDGYLNHYHLSSAHQNHIWFYGE